MQGPGPLLAGAQFGSKYCLWKCPVLGCLELVQTQAKGNVTASCLDQGTEPSLFLSGSSPSVDATHNKCIWGQSMTSPALSRGSGSNIALLLGRPQNVKNTAIPKPKQQGLWRMLLWYFWQATGVRTVVRPDQKSSLEALGVISRVLKKFFPLDFV